MTAKKKQLPDGRGYFGQFGGKFVPETLMPALAELEQAYAEAQADPEFKREFERFCRDYIGRPTPLYPAERLSAKLHWVGSAISPAVISAIGAPRKCCGTSARAIRSRRAAKMTSARPNPVAAPKP